MAGRPPVRRYPVGPLAAALNVEVPSLASVLRMSGSTWIEVRDRGMADATADRVAVRAGFHPFLVWPEMLDHRLEYEDWLSAQARARMRPVHNRGSGRVVSAGMDEGTAA